MTLSFRHFILNRPARVLPCSLIHCEGVFR